jgi:hypothetical protein
LYEEDTQDHMTLPFRFDITQLVLERANFCSFASNVQMSNTMNVFILSDITGSEIWDSEYLTFKNYFQNTICSSLGLQIKFPVHESLGHFADCGIDFSR